MLHSLGFLEAPPLALPSIGVLPAGSVWIVAYWAGRPGQVGGVQRLAVGPVCVENGMVNFSARSTDDQSRPSERLKTDAWRSSSSRPPISSLLRMFRVS